MYVLARLIKQCTSGMLPMGAFYTNTKQQHRYMKLIILRTAILLHYVQVIARYVNFSNI